MLSSAVLLSTTLFAVGREVIEISDTQSVDSDTSGGDYYTNHGATYGSDFYFANVKEVIFWSLRMS